MSSGDVSHPISSSPTRPCGLAGRAHSRTPHAAHPGSHTWDRHKSLSTRSSTRPAHTTDNVWYGLNHLCHEHSRSTHAGTLTAPASGVYTYWHICQKSAYTVTHGCAVPLRRPHTLLHKAVSCVSALSGHRLRQSSSGHISHPDMGPELGQEHMPANWLGLLSPKCPRFRLTERRPDPRPCRSS